MTPKLKPCPFCGAGAELLPSRSLDGISTVLVGCGNRQCNVNPHSVGWNSREAFASRSAVAAWNRRAGK